MGSIHAFSHSSIEMWPRNWLLEPCGCWKCLALLTKLSGLSLLHGWNLGNAPVQDREVPPEAKIPDLSPR